MATYTVGSGQTYATIADAYAAVVSAVGGTAATETHYIDLYGGATFSENITLGNFTACFCTPENPLVIRTADGESEATITGDINCQFAPYFEIRDVTFNGKIDPNYVTFGFRMIRCEINMTATVSPHLHSVIFEDCDIDSGTGSYAFYLSGGSFDRSTSVTFKRCNIRCRTRFVWAANTCELYIDFEQCRFLITTGTDVVYSANGGSNYTSNRIYFLHNSFFFDTSSDADVVELYCPSGNPVGPDNWRYVFRNNIVEGGGTSKVFNITDTYGYIGRKAFEMTGNRYYNMTKIITSQDFDISTVSGMQAIGLDTYSTEGDPGFVSTTWGNANFLDISASLGTAKNVGIYSDKNGTAMTKWSDIDPGAHQYAAATEDSGGPIRIVVPTNKKLTLP